jgi:hypothetical protein
MKNEQTATLDELNLVNRIIEKGFGRLKTVVANAEKDMHDALLDFVKDQRPKATPCHYRSAGQPYDVQLVRSGDKVTAITFKMPKEKVGQGILIEYTHYSIQSERCPGITDDTLFLWGHDRCDDSEMAIHYFVSETAAINWFNNIVCLLKSLNKNYKVLVPTPCGSFKMRKPPPVDSSRLEGQRIDEKHKGRTVDIKGQKFYIHPIVGNPVGGYCRVIWFDQEKQKYESCGIKIGQWLLTDGKQWIVRDLG